MSYTVAAADKALTILEALANHPEYGVTELATLTESTKSQVFRLLYTLEQRGYVIKNHAKQYSLGYRCLYIGEQSKQQINIIQLAQPYMDELTLLSQENVHLVTREGKNSVCIALSESPQPLRLYARVGRRGPLHAGGGSKVLLAFAPEKVQQDVLLSGLEKFTEHTTTDPQALKAILSTIQKENFHECFNDLDEGAFSISAPIRDFKNEVVAALSIAGPTSRLTPEARNGHIVSVKDYAEKLSRALGWPHYAISSD
jgi:IclR family KDG regulon transcriptional repressor